MAVDPHTHGGQRLKMPNSKGEKSGHLPLSMAGIRSIDLTKAKIISTVVDWCAAFGIAQYLTVPHLLGRGMPSLRRDPSQCTCALARSQIDATRHVTALSGGS